MIDALTKFCLLSELYSKGDYYWTTAWKRDPMSTGDYAFHERNSRVIDSVGTTTEHRGRKTDRNFAPCPG
ncbi:hypothetical protein NEOLEDRAFT_1134876 [Neolentinus lepideus HHB14362 ss-1]|uniref:Uncharacterized protein n=1 Tax=Neolentinus lepideus HHB14362 ss-1 TaxID=1314782 RepID=A0A165S0B0_9AGAM|nr:hypothetical protein NEOLEDRAFT_1134876 [Neolentinus lepideus HHB14362 ss-1]